VSATSQRTSAQSTFHQGFLARHGNLEPPYCPDMAPCDFWLFSQLKTVLKGNRFEDVDEIKKNVTGTLNTIPKDSFKICFQQWQDRWEKCVTLTSRVFSILLNDFRH
jgi:hypothetical protein